MSILVTGAAGFLGLHVIEALLDRGDAVIGVDPLAAGYDPSLKAARLRQLEGQTGFTFVRGEAEAAIADGPEVTAVVHLATHDARVCGHQDFLDLCRDRLPALRHLVYVSRAPDDLLAKAHATLHRLPQTGLRIGAVYGPWGRPDAPYFAMADAIASDRPITLTSNFDDRLLYVDDAAAGVLAALDHSPSDDNPPHRVLDLAGDPPVATDCLITVLEDTLGRPADRRYADWPARPLAGPVPDLAATGIALAWRPTTTIEHGMAAFAAWHRNYYTG